LVIFDVLVLRLCGLQSKFRRDLDPRLRYYYIRFLKTNSRRVGILLTVSIFIFISSSSGCHSASAYQVSSKSDHPKDSYNHMTSYPFSKMAATPSLFYFRFRFSWLHPIWKLKSTCRPNYGETPHSEILLLPISENNRPACWHSTSPVDFHVCGTIGMSLCICLPHSPNRTIYDVL